MAVNDVIVRATPAQVWDVLADGWLYPLWVVGATRMRAVDASWPEVGARLHHSAGTWPALVNDETTVLACEPHRRLELQAKAWPFGEAKVEIVLEELPSGTRVELREDAVDGPGRLVPDLVRQPMLHWRNGEALQRLALLVEGRAGR